jgi:hypothetical protein
VAERIFLEVVMPVFLEPSSRWVIEDRLDEALKASRLGQVTGGGGGDGTSNIDFEATAVNDALAVIRDVFEEFREYECARGVVVNQYEPAKVVHRLE